MPLNLNHIGQIALPVNDVDRAETFYENVIGLRKLYRFGDLSFFDCSGVRLLLERTNDPANFKAQGCIYFRCADIALTVATLEKRGVTFTHRPHCIVAGFHGHAVPLRKLGTDKAREHVAIEPMGEHKHFLSVAARTTGE